MQKICSIYRILESGAGERKPDYEKIQAKGIDSFEDKDVFLVCSRRIREENYTEDDFLSYLAFEMFRRGQYDKVTNLSYLAEYTVAQSEI
mgnify:FL=1